MTTDPIPKGERDTDSLASIAREVRAFALHGESADASERDAMIALADRAEKLCERLQAIVDWADFALANPAEFDGHGVQNLAGPVFDEARSALLLQQGQDIGRPVPPHGSGP